MPHVKVTLRLPFRMQVADDTEFRVPFRDDLYTLVTLREYEVPKTDEEEHGTGIDDGRGTFLQSNVSVLFPEQTLYEIRDHWGVGAGTQYVDASLLSINECIQSYRYVTRHLFARPIAQPREVTVVVVDGQGELVPNVVFTHAFTFPGGMRLKGTFQSPALEQIQLTLDGDSPIKFERSLLLDAEYFAELGDVSNALFYVDTALQVFIERILPEEHYQRNRYYSNWDEGLKLAHGHSLYEGHFIDSHSLNKRVNSFEILEFIHVVRNSIAHEGRPIFRLSALQGGWQSQFIENHSRMDGARPTVSEAREWVRYGREIIQWVESFTE